MAHRWHYLVVVKILTALHTAVMNGEPNVKPDNAPTTSTGRIPADTFSNRLLLARKLAGLTIREAAAKAGLSYGSWSNWENGMRPHGQVDVCVAIAEALDVDFNWLLMGGPLAGARGVPTKRPGGDNVGYLPSSERPTDTRPPTRSAKGRTVTPTINPRQRRAARIQYPIAA